MIKRFIKNVLIFAFYLYAKNQTSPIEICGKVWYNQVKEYRNDVPLRDCFHDWRRTKRLFLLDGRKHERVGQ